MSPRTNNQNQEIKRYKKKLIIEAALLLFSVDGFNATSMQSIANKAKVSKGNLYNYFESKEALLESVLTYGLNECLESFKVQNSKIITETDFKQAVYANFEMIKANKTFWKLYYNLVTQPKVQVFFNKVFAPFLEKYMNMFEAYFRNKGDKTPNATALLLGSTIDGISLGYIIMGEAYPLKEVLEQLIDKFK